MDEDHPNYDPLFVRSETTAVTENKDDAEMNVGNIPELNDISLFASIPDMLQRSWSLENSLAYRQSIDKRDILQPFHRDNPFAEGFLSNSFKGSLHSFNDSVNGQDNKNSDTNQQSSTIPRKLETTSSLRFPILPSLEESFSRGFDNSEMLKNSFLTFDTTQKRVDESSAESSIHIDKMFDLRSSNRSQRGFPFTPSNQEEIPTLKIDQLMSNQTSLQIPEAPDSEIPMQPLFTSLPPPPPSSSLNFPPYERTSHIPVYQSPHQPVYQSPNQDVPIVEPQSPSLLMAPAIIMEPVPGSPGYFKAVGTITHSESGLVIGSPQLESPVLGAPLIGSPQGSPSIASSLGGSPVMNSPAGSTTESISVPSYSVPTVATREESGSPSSSLKPLHGYEGKKMKELVGVVDGVEVVSVVPDMKEAKKGNRWTEEEDRLLIQAVNMVEEGNWVKVSQYVPGRDNTQCMQRYMKVLKPGLKKGKWSQEEDKMLLKLVRELGTNNWDDIASHIEGRSAGKCRERYTNYLNPEVKKGDWTDKEDRLILELQQQWGNKWAAIAQKLPQRTANDIKSRWKSLTRKGRRRISTTSV